MTPLPDIALDFLWGLPAALVLGYFIVSLLYHMLFLYYQGGDCPRWARIGVSILTFIFWALTAGLMAVAIGVTGAIIRKAMGGG